MCNLCCILPGRGGAGQEKRPGHGPGGPGHDGDGREDAPQPGPQRTRRGRGLAPTRRTSREPAGEPAGAM